MAEDDDDRTEAASGRRITEARNKGQVPTSKELSTFLGLAGGVIGLIIFSDRLIQAFKQLLINGLTFDWKLDQQTSQMTENLLRKSMDMLIAFAPWLGVVVLAAIIGPFLLHGWLFTFTPLAPDLKKLNPLNGLKRMFALSSLVELFKAVLKSSLIGGIAILALWHERDVLIELSRMESALAYATVWSIGIKIVLYGILGMLLVAAVDVPYQIWQYYKSMRMTKQEVKDEAKEAEGNPQIKGKIRALQREAARRRMMKNVPTASVIVTNPTHYAVAILYNDKMETPKVVAKGASLIAERIIDIGKENKVPVLRTPPFARALYKHAELEADIPAPLFTATAEIFAYLYHLKVYEQSGGSTPILPTKLSIPEDMIPPGED
ncbi:flagellar biosynthesis protein FlhB [Leeia sp. TBRC 13508]|uniref:Flagellar biosynthetic protein FlhB n=1 Tax=Leeia speluncae TaxID=2884804 RepID=A0ABS8D683_9NEIS|nr:flagellar biosynthesis protein FlhB [Leeia speluncae]MCB6183705.1 flagellar biosynthesis protein FlhB [Leeia speluncae]